MQISKAQEAEQMLTFSKMTGIGMITSMSIAFRKPL